MKKAILASCICFVLAAFAAWAADVPVAPGEGTLAAAVTAAADGDVLLLVPDGLYTESTGTEFGTITGRKITVAVDGDGSVKAKLQVLTDPGDGSTVFFNLADQGSLVLRGLDCDGSVNGAATTTYLLGFYMGDFPAPTNVKTIRIEDCRIHDLTGSVIAAGNGDQAGQVVVDSTLIDDCVVENTGTSVYYKYAGADFISLTRSTFNTINSYGLRIAGPGYTNLADHTPTVIVDRTTWYNTGTTDGREMLLLEKGPNQNPWTVTNSIFVKQVEKSKTVINIKEMTTPDLAAIHHLCLWDVGARKWADHPVTDTLNVDPGFADPDAGDFTLPAGSPLLTFGSDGGPIGDPRWAGNASGVETAAAPGAFGLAGNYPNPFNPSTTIVFRTERPGRAVVTVHDLAGREVGRAADGVFSAGEHRVSFDGRTLQSGIYLVTLQSGGRIATAKMMLVK